MSATASSRPRDAATRVTDAVRRRAEVLGLLAAGDPDTPLVARVCEVGAGLLGVSGAGMCLVGGTRQQVLVHGTDPLIQELEDLQVSLGQGPCVEAVRTAAPVLVPEIAGHGVPAWAAFADRARHRGVRALFAFPLMAGAVPIGAFDLYRVRPGALDAGQLADAGILAQLAGDAVLARADRRRPDDRVGALAWLAAGNRTADPVLGRAEDLGLTVRDALGALPPVTGPDPRTAAPRILVVDDDPGIRLVLGRALARCGYEVILASSGAEALGQLAADPVVALVSDVAMPSMSGLELASAVLERHPGLPILFVTSSSVDDDLLEHPLVALVGKPVRVADVRDALGRLIERAVTGPAPCDPADA